MKNLEGSQKLAIGQVWKTSAADIEILKLGKRFIHYRVTPQFGQKWVSAQVSRIEALATYLARHAAQLANPAAGPSPA